MPEEIAATIAATITNLEMLQENAQEILDIIADERAALSTLLRTLGGKKECA